MYTRYAACSNKRQPCCHATSVHGLAVSTHLVLLLQHKKTSEWQHMLRIACASCFCLFHWLMHDWDNAQHMLLYAHSCIQLHPLKESIQTWRGMHPWAARYNTWLSFELTLKGVVFSFLLFLKGLARTVPASSPSPSFLWAHQGLQGSDLWTGMSGLQSRLAHHLFLPSQLPLLQLPSPKRKDHSCKRQVSHCQNALLLLTQ